MTTEAVTLDSGDKSGSNGTQDGGNQNQNGSGAGGNQNGNTDFFAGLSSENKEFATKKGWKSLDDAFKSHREAELLISRGGHKAAVETDPEKVVPVTPQLYEFKVPDGLDERSYDKAFVDQFRTWAHKSGLTNKQANALHDQYLSFTGQKGKAHADAQLAQLSDRVANTHAELTKAWGQPETATFKQSLEYAKRAMRFADPGLKDALVEAGMIVTGADGKEVVTNAAVMKALAKLGSEVYAEDSLYSDKTQAENPFDPKTANMARQGELVKNNPELAKTLIRAAGQEKVWANFLNKR